MAIIKSYTNLQQSKKLSEILSLETADMLYAPFGDTHPWIWNGEVKLLEKDSIPCWSLAALLDVIPQEIFDGEYIINITEGCDNEWVLTYDYWVNRNHSFYGLSSSADNLVDACVDIIIKLKERNLL